MDELASPLKSIWLANRELCISIAKRMELDPLFMGIEAVVQRRLKPA